MKIVIDIPKEAYKNLLNNYSFSSEEIPIISLAIATGTPLPNDATNGDVIRAAFPKAEVIEKRAVVMVGISRMIVFDLDWWNAPYKVGDTDGK